MIRSRRALLTVAQAGALLSFALATERQALADSERSELGFSADEVEADARMGELVLRGNVVVTYERFRLTSPSLALRRTARGIEVDGPGEVVFCPCPSPPVTIGFAGGLVGPPADLVLRHPQLRVGGATILSLPWFWLRSPARAGVLPPTIAWRGRDGLLLGAGAHVPWRTEDGFDEADFTVAGYVKGGVEVTARVRTARSTNRLRWDHLGSDLLALDARGVAGGERQSATFTWDVDAARGPRARSATLNLADAALAYDSAAFETALRVWDAAMLGVGLRALSPRGGYGPGDTSMWGPRATLAAGGAIGRVGAWDGSVVGATFAGQERGPAHVARTQAGFTLAARPGPLAARVDVRETSTFAAGPDGSGWDAVGSARAELALPLARAYAGSSDEGAAPLVHTIEPRLSAGLLAAGATAMPWTHARASYAPLAMLKGQSALLAIGTKTSWGRLFGRSAATLEGDAGALARLGTATNDLTPVARVRGAWSDRLWSVALEGAETLRAPWGQVWVSRTRIGDPLGWHVSAHVAGRRGADPLLARSLLNSGTAPSGGFLASEGWSGGVQIGARLGGGISALIAMDEDFTTRTLLQVRGSVAYAHPCRCVAVDAFAGQRLGREGVDVWVSIDLAPR